MPTMPYINGEGKRVGGTTYVIGQNCGWNKDALMGWANREGLAGRSIRGERTTAGRAADIGTAAHTMIEAHILGQDPEVVATPEMLRLAPGDQVKARQGFKSFLHWFTNQRMVVVATELYGVDEAHQTGYCLDALVIDDPEAPLSAGRFGLADWKSSKGTYADHVIQVAAYCTFEEKRLSTWFGEPVRFSGAHIVRVGKDNGNFKHAFWTRDSLEVAWKAFSWLRALHEVRWEIENLAK